jgi:hypothetical protein
MRKYVILLVLSIHICNAYSQNYDLIVKTNGDSIACRIDSITDMQVYFEMKHNGNWSHTYMNNTEIEEIRQDVIDKKSVKFQTGTSFIDSSLPGRHTGKKNVVYGTLGFLGVWAVANLNYERKIMVREDKFINSLLIRVGGGTWASWDVSGPHAVAGLTLLTGKKNSHIEIDFGITTLYDRLGYKLDVSDAESGYGSKPSRSDYMATYPAGGIGYRFQKPDGTFVFRTGITFPESFYISFGVHF